MRVVTGGILLGLFAAGAACGDDDGGSGAAAPSAGVGAADVVAGDTVFVAIVNPVVNAGHSTGEPDELGEERDGIDVDAEPGEEDVTADEGLAVVDVPVGAIDLTVGPAPPLAHSVLAEGDVYDAAVAFDGAGAAFFADTPIRYAVGLAEGASYFDVDDDIAVIGEKLSEDDVVVVLGPGTYVGSLSLSGTNVLLFGQGWSENAVVIDGSVTANGQDARVRGLTITGDLTANGNNFGVSFSVVHGSTNITGNSGTFLRNVFCGDTVVPTSNATLLDNYGVEPIATPPAEACP